MDYYKAELKSITKWTGKMKERKAKTLFNKRVEAILKIANCVKSPDTFQLSQQDQIVELRVWRNNGNNS